MRNAIIQALEDKYEAEISAAHATINIYLTNSVGIGEHSDLPLEIYKWVDRLASAEDALLALERYEDRSE